MIIGVAGNGAEHITQALRSFEEAEVTTLPEGSHIIYHFNVLIVNSLPSDGGLWNAKAGAIAVNSDVDGIMKSIPPEFNELIVTYGFNKKACVTASSVTDDTCTICVQRGFTDITGRCHNQGEFNFYCRECTHEAALAAASALMAGGVL